MAQYYCGPDCKVYLTTGNESVHIDNAYAINYNEQSEKHPLYGYRDYEFSQVTQGRTIVSGLLILNREFKNELTAAIKGDSLGSKPKNAERPVGKYIDVNMVNEQLNSSKNILENLYSRDDDINRSIISLVSAAKQIGVDVSLPTGQVVYRNALRNLIKEVESAINSEINDGESQTIREITNQLNTRKESFVEALKNKYWRQKKDINNRNKLEDPSSYDTLEYLRKNNVGPVSLEVHFGDSVNDPEYGDHKDIIYDVYFSGSSNQNSIDSREVNKIYYQFIARKIN